MSVLIQEIKQKTSKYKTNLYIEMTIDDAIGYANIIAEHLANARIKTHQLRRFFSAIKNIQNNVDSKNMQAISPLHEEDYAELQMLRPQLANAAGRLKFNEKKAFEDFIEITKPIFQQVKNNQDFKRFVNFFESIIAYHKAYALE